MNRMPAWVPITLFLTALLAAGITLTAALWSGYVLPMVLAFLLGAGIMLLVQVARNRNRGD